MTARRRAGWVSVASVLWLLAAGVSAQGSDRLPQGRSSDGESPPGRMADGDAPQRVMPPEQRPAQLSPRDAWAPGGGNRLSREERRQLRRDVHEAGRDLYSGRMSPGRHEPRRQ